MDGQREKGVGWALEAGGRKEGGRLGREGERDGGRDGGREREREGRVSERGTGGVWDGRTGG